MVNKKIKNKITKNILIWEIAEKYPKITDVLMEKYGLHCLGCSMSAVESLEEGAMAHGMEKKEIEEMVKDLNEIVNKVDGDRKKK